MRAAVVDVRDLVRGRFWPLLAVSLTAWIALVVADRTLIFPLICAGSNPAWGKAFVTFAAFAQLNASSPLVFSSLLMLCAMMAPLLQQPLAHLTARSLAERRTRASVLFLSAYATVWLLALLAIAVISAALHQAARESDGAALLLMLGIAAIWWGSAIRKRLLARCHALPPLRAFGVAAELDSLRFGASTAGWCAASCWALMAVPFFAGRAHLVAMGVAAALMLLQQHERSAERRMDARFVSAGLATIVLGAAWTIW